MKKYAFLLLTVILLPSFKVTNSKVLMYIEDNSRDLGFMLTHEVGKMKQILEQSGFVVEIASMSGETFQTDSVTVQPDLKLDDVNINDYEGFILPCMAPKDTIITPEERMFVRNIVNGNKPLAAQTGAVLILAKAGLLKGKKYAYFDEEMASEIENGIYSGMGVVQDGNIITSGTCPMHAKISGNPDGTAELTSLLVKAMKAQK